jgi:antirestriction protein ArdC
MKKDIYTEATNRIIAQLEQGAAPWVKSWSTVGGGEGLPYNANTGKTYSGVNIVFLAIAGMNYGSAGWLTFKQAKALGGSVRAGEKGTKIYYMAPVVKTVKTDNDEDKTNRFLILKEYTVFNIEQCTDLPEKVIRPAKTKLPKSDNERHEDIETFLNSVKHKVTLGSNKASYITSVDYITMPRLEQFKSSANYYATYFHELGHWTGAKIRLDRDLSGRFGNAKYAAEELIAELTSAFLCAEFSIDGDLRHAGYIESWLKLLKDDPKAIFTAASKAQQAAQFLRENALAGLDTIHDNEFEPEGVAA